MKNIIVIFSIYTIASMLPSAAAYADSDTAITVDFIGTNTIDLQKYNRLVRMNVSIENYNPGDGYYFLKITNNAGEINDSEIYPKYKTGGLWGVQVAYLIDDSLDNILGEHSVMIYTEFGPKSNKITFSVIDLIQNNDNTIKEESKDMIQKIIETVKKSNDEKSKQQEIATDRSKEKLNYGFYEILDRILEKIKEWFYVLLGIDDDEK